MLRSNSKMAWLRVMRVRYPAQQQQQQQQPPQANRMRSLSGMKAQAL
jgi:hypothetical protein